ncbi:hypothetical protein N657DRAFT_647370 [Parathielavia appendiculata]|uniref:Uncharacterized protein n=1 Tax=Parathielavia appendiculata TaxID=2587402 RepID=A0AAN6TX84_9PEZI|nr:hypothetical protein N657DRAFT_647370 [Parathielavia appendiculata]
MAAFNGPRWLIGASTATLLPYLRYLLFSHADQQQHRQSSTFTTFQFNHCFDGEQLLPAHISAVIALRVPTVASIQMRQQSDVFLRSTHGPCDEKPFG